MNYLKAVAALTGLIGSALTLLDPSAPRWLPVAIAAGITALVYVVPNLEGKSKCPQSSPTIPPTPVVSPITPGQSFPTPETVAFLGALKPADGRTPGTGG